MKIQATCDKRVLDEHPDEVSKITKALDLVYKKAANDSLIAFRTCVEKECEKLAEGLKKGGLKTTQA